MSTSILKVLECKNELQLKSLLTITQSNHQHTVNNKTSYHV